MGTVEATDVEAGVATISGRGHGLQNVQETQNLDNTPGRMARLYFAEGPAISLSTHTVLALLASSEAHH